MESGFFTIHRKIFTWYGATSAKRVQLLVFLIGLANHKENTFIFNGEKILVKRGQFITGRKKLSDMTGTSESYIEKLLTEFEKYGILEQQKSNRNRLISIINYNGYQALEQQKDNRKTTERHKQPYNNDNNNKDILSGKPDLKEPILYLNEKANKNFSPTNRVNTDLVKARLKEGRTIADFKKVIDRKSSQWINDNKMIDYLRPKTLFSATNFENYLNEKDSENAGMDKLRAKFGLGKD